MIVREVAVIEEAVENQTIGDFPFPKVLRLVRYVKLHWRKAKPRWSKRRLFERDGYRCAYCAGAATTVDHVDPRDNGGETTWLNTVASCFSCNNRKGNRTPKQAGLKLLVTPYEPAWSQITV
jgi:5-methylcytosine-specific restriction endonuclease McrA